MLGSIFTERFFRRFGLLTVYSIFFLIFVGGLVRVTGSGMGCPDWPMCFGQVVPPTDESQLPPDYKIRFQKGDHKVADFNVYHTWTEYINRLIGVFTGIFILVTMVSSFQFRKTEPGTTMLAVLSFILVGFQGWIGKVVVDSYLAGWMVTIHMLLALVVVGLVMLAVFRNSPAPEIKQKEQLQVLKNLSWIALILTLVQIGLGTQVREAIDAVLLRGAEGTWLENADGLIQSHIFLSVFILGLSLLLFIRTNKLVSIGNRFRKAQRWAFYFTLIQILTGILNRWLNLPDVAQVLHICVGTFMAGCWFYGVIVLREKNLNKQT